LTFAQTRKQHYLPVRKFQRIMVRGGVVHIDLPETGEPLSDLLVRQNPEPERWRTLDITVKRNFGAGK
jgi:hypothetical protein